MISRIYFGGLDSYWNSVTQKNVNWNESIFRRRFEWTYVSVVYSDTEYGNHGYETLVSLANNYSICFSAPQRIDKERFVPEDYDNVIRTIANKTEVRGRFPRAIDLSRLLSTSALQCLEFAYTMVVDSFNHS